MMRVYLAILGLVTAIAAPASFAEILTISIFPGTTGQGGVDAPQLEARYAPLMSYLKSAKAPTVFLPAPSIDVAKADIASTIDMLIGPMPVAAPAFKAGWTPLAVRSDKIRAAIYVRADSNIKNAADLAGKRISLPDAKTLIAIEAKQVLAAAKIEAKITETGGDQKLLLKSALDLKQYDAVAVRDTVAKECLAANTCRQVAAHAGYPGFVLLAKNPTNPRVVAAAKAFIALDPTKNEDVLLGLDGAKKGAKPPAGFSVPSDADVNAIRNFN